MSAAFSKEVFRTAEKCNNNRKDTKMSEAKTITDANFETEVLKTDKPMLVDFWAPWCAPCKTIDPVIEEIAGNEKDMLVGKMNVDENPLTASKYSILSIPAFLIFVNGEVVDKLIGAQPKEVIESHIRKVLDG